MFVSIFQKIIHSTTNADFFTLTHNGYRLGEVAEHKTSIELQMFKF